MAALHGAGAILRFTSATGLVLEATKAANALQVETLAPENAGLTQAFGRDAQPVKAEYIEPYEIDKTTGLVKSNPTVSLVSRGQQPQFNENGMTLWVAAEKDGAVDLRVGKELPMPDVAPSIRPDGTPKTAKFGHCTLVDSPTAIEQRPAVFVGGETKPFEGGIIMDNNSGRFSKFVGDTRQALLASGRHMAQKTGKATRKSCIPP